MYLLARCGSAGQLLAQLPCVSRALHIAADAAAMCSTSSLHQAAQGAQQHHVQQPCSSKWQPRQVPNCTGQRQHGQASCAGQHAAATYGLPGRHSFASSTAMADAPASASHVTPEAEAAFTSEHAGNASEGTEAAASEANGSDREPATGDSAEEPGPAAATTAVTAESEDANALSEEEQRQQQMAEFNELMKVLIQPISRSAAYNGQLAPHMVNVSGHYYIEPSKALASMVQALLVIKNVLKEDGHIYVVENNPLLKTLLHHAASCCTNPNMWFYADKWVPGMLTNYNSQRRLFKASHQPNRRLFQSRGVRMTNPHCPQPSPLASTPPRLSWPDKWSLYTRSRRHGHAEQLLRLVMQAEDRMQKYQLHGSLRGRARRLQLLVVLDSTLNPIALSEAQQRNMPTIALVNNVRDLSGITYPVLARDFHPAFVHFFLDWIVKVANVKGEAQQQEGTAAQATA